MTPDPPFEDLLQRARQREDEAWRLIYRDLAPMVRGYLRSRGALEPDDVTGEVFYQVARDLHRFKGDERAFKAWVFKIAHHRFLDDLRSRKRRPVVPAPDEVLTESGPSGDVQEEALGRLGDAEVRRLLRELSKDQAAVIALRVLGQLRIDEIARVVGKRPGAVHALLRRGFASLRRQISQEP